MFRTTNYCGYWNHGSGASTDAQRNDPMMTLFQPLAPKEKANSRVISPEWFLSKERVMDSPFESEESSASELNAVPPFVESQIDGLKFIFHGNPLRMSFTSHVTMQISVPISTIRDSSE
jgi:hypothetical protein